MASRNIVLKIIKMFLTVITFCLFAVSLLNLYCFIESKEIIYAVEFICLLLSAIAVFGIKTQISKLLNSSFEYNSAKKEQKEIIGAELDLLFKEEKRSKEVNGGRKAKRYLPKNNNLITVVYNMQKKEHKESVEIINISRSGMLITSSRKISNSLKAQFGLNVIIEGEIVRDGIHEEKNAYFYGIKFKNIINNRNFNMILEKI